MTRPKGASATTIGSAVTASSRVPRASTGRAAWAPWSQTGTRRLFASAKKGGPGPYATSSVLRAITPARRARRTRWVSPRARATKGTAGRTANWTALRATTRLAVADPPITSVNFPALRRRAAATIRPRAWVYCASWCARSPTAVTECARIRWRVSRTTGRRCSSARVTPPFAGAYILTYIPKHLLKYPITTQLLTNHPTFTGATTAGSGPFATIRAPAARTTPRSRARSRASAAVRARLVRREPRCATA